MFNLNCRGGASQNMGNFTEIETIAKRGLQPWQINDRCRTTTEQNLFDVVDRYDLIFFIIRYTSIVSSTEKEDNVMKRRRRDKREERKYSRRLKRLARPMNERLQLL